jgi:hypothetical protein
MPLHRVDKLMHDAKGRPVRRVTRYIERHRARGLVPVTVADSAPPAVTEPSAPAHSAGATPLIPQPATDTERERLMADLARQIETFSERLALVENQTESIATGSAEKLGEIRARLAQMAKSVAAIESHDGRQNARLDALETATRSQAERLDQIETDLGILGLGAESIASKDFVS